MPPAASAESMVDIPRGHLFFKLQYLYNTNGGHSLRLIETDLKNFAPMIWPWRRSSARPWHGLAPVCQKWWHVISMSPCRLDPWILFKFGAPIGNILCSWPTLEIELHGVGLQFSAIRQVLLSANNVIGLRFPMSRIPSIFHQKTS